MTPAADDPNESSWLVIRVADERQCGKLSLATMVEWQHRGAQAWRDCILAETMMLLIEQQDPMQAMRIGCACVRLLALDGPSLAVVETAEAWTRGEVSADSVTDTADTALALMGPSDDRRDDPARDAIQTAALWCAVQDTRTPAILLANASAHALAMALHRERGGHFVFDRWEMVWQCEGGDFSRTRADAYRLVCDEIRRHVPTLQLIIKESP